MPEISTRTRSVRFAEEVSEAALVRTRAVILSVGSTDSKKHRTNEASNILASSGTNNSVLVKQYKDQNDRIGEIRQCKNWLDRI